MLIPLVTRRAVLGALALPWLAGCSPPLPLIAAPPSDPGATRTLHESAEAHGLSAYRQLADINVSYSGEWRPLIGSIQPEVTDTGFRGSSQERLMPKAGVAGQAYTGTRGRKQVTWRRGSGASDDLGEVAVWFNGARSADPAAQQAAALVAEGYGLFLLGPLWLVDRDLPMRRAGTELVDGRLCDVVEVWLRPGLGRVRSDRVALCVDRSDRVTRRIRFTLEGFAKTRGAVAEVDTFDHEKRFGVTWPMRSFERVIHPVALPAHDWRITGLDVNRGYDVQALTGPEFSGGAAAPATPM
ncbi:MAG: hypothetical protein ABIQ06_10130 [Caldimonas sp.]